MLKWEYKIVYQGQLNQSLFAGKFKQLGEGGWIYCGTDGFGNWIFRRPIDPNPEGEK